MSRRTAAEVENDAVQALISALGSLGVVSRAAHREAEAAGGSADLVIHVAGVDLIVEVKSVVAAADGERLAGESKHAGRLAIVVADRLAAEAKRAFREAGVSYFDRRGEIRIIAPPVIIDTTLRSSTPRFVPTSGALSSQVAKEVAITCLLAPDRSHGVREVANYIDRAPSAVSRAMRALRDDGLLTSRGEPLVPDLFHELANVWRRRPTPLADRPVRLAGSPQPGSRRTNRQLDLGLDDVEHSEGWALTDTLAASSWRMPVVAQGDFPPDFYVPSDAAFQRARSLLGDAATVDQRACTVAVAPVRLVCLRRCDHSQTSGEVWPVANHVVVALDIAQDRARGLEVLDQWHPEDIVRAW